jgi:hypothetical protein
MTQEATSEPRAGLTDFNWYVVNQVLFFASQGIGMILFPWLVTFVLNTPAAWVGVAQGATMLPMLVLILFAGAKADRSDIRKWLIQLHLVAVAPPLVLAYILYSDNLTYWSLILYGLATASIGSFVGPARDSLLTKVAETDRPDGMQRAVGVAMACQFGAQLIGISLAGQAESIGAHILPIVISISFLGCALAMRQLPASVSGYIAPIAATKPRFFDSLRSQFSEIREGMSEVRRSERLRPVIIMMFTNGLLFMGSVMVFLPLMIREVYGGGGGLLSLMYVCFFGSIGLSSIIVSRIPIRRQGRALMLAMTGGGFMLAAMSLGLPQWGFFMAIMSWGLAGGVSVSMSRTIVQTGASDTHRARVLSVFTLAMMSGGPIGSLIMGALVANFGVLNAALFPPVALIFVWAAMFFGTNLWRIEAETGSATPKVA